MERTGFKKWVILAILLRCVHASGMEGCKCTTHLELCACHCEGVLTDANTQLKNCTLNKLSMENGNFTYFFENKLPRFKNGLEDLTITMTDLKYFHDGILTDMISLKILRITHTSLRQLPRMESTMRMGIIDFESNRIEKIEGNTMKVEVEQLILDYNLIQYIGSWAFNGSEIDKLSLKGNTLLTDISENAFDGIKSLRNLDLSETSISFLPAQGLEHLETLTIKDTYTLKIIPSIYKLSKLQEAVLTYSFHCCAFHNPEKHDPEKHKEYQKLRKKHCKHEQHRLVRDFGEFVEQNYTDFLSEITEKGVSENIRYDDDEIFHSTTAKVENSSDNSAICGALTGKNVSCYPKADALNPCEDMMSWTWLRVSVWFVLSTAIFGNISVLIVLCLSRTEKTVPRYLMCNLAFADLVMAIYLTMLAIMDLVSTESYFNYAYDWQRGVGCKIAGFLTVFASQLSLFTLSLLTLERWFAIKHALYLNFLDLKLTGNIMLGGWMYSILMAALPLFGVSSYSSTSICLPMDTHNMISQAYIIIMVFIAGCSFVLMCVCYIQIYSSLSDETRHSIGEGSVARKMTILVGTNFVCWAPVTFFTLTALAGYPLITVTQSKILLVFIYPINTCANPYLYAILTQQFRKDFMTIISRYTKCKQSYHYRLGYARPPRNDTLNDTRTRTTTAETLL